MEFLGIIGTILFLVFLECALSLDNAVVLAVLVKSQPEKLRKRALMYGMWGAFGFRVLGLLALSYVLSFGWVKAIAGAYLLYLAGKNFFAVENGDEEEQAPAPMSFWATVAMVEVTDVAFAFDSLFAAAGLNQAVWIVALGGIIGILAMRFAACGVSILLDKMPGLESVAYRLVALIGLKLVLEAFDVGDFHTFGAPLCTLFWMLMAFTVVHGYCAAHHTKQDDEAKAA